MKKSSKLKDWWNRAVLGEVDEDGKKPSPVNLANEIIAAYGLHSIFKWDMFDITNNLYYNENSVSFCLELIPQTGADQEMVRRLTTLFSPIPPETGIQIMMFGNTILDETYSRYFDLRREAFDKKHATEFGIELAEKRASYVNRKKGRPLFQNSNYMIKRPTLLLSVTRQGNYTDEKLVTQMFTLCGQLMASLKSAGFPSVIVNPNGLIRILYPIFNPEVLFNDEKLPPSVYDDGKPIKEQITKLGHAAEVRRQHVLFGDVPEQGRPDERIAMRTFGIMRYPQRKELYEMGDIVGAMYDDTLQYPCPYIITTGIYTLDPNQAETTANLKNMRAKQNANSSQAKYQPEFADIARDWESVIHHLNNGGQMCELYHTVSLIAPFTSIDDYSQTALGIWKNQRFTLAPLDFLQCAAWYAAMPMTFTTNARDDLKRIKLLSTKTTINAIDMSPLLSEWQGVGDPVMMFFGRRGTPIFLDFYSNAQGNYNLFVTGVSGAGKSVILLEVVSAYKGIGAQVYILDVGRSYKNFVSLEGGVIFDFNASRKICMNPFSWMEVADEETQDQNTLKQELRLLRPMYAKMAQPEGKLDAFQLALLSEALTVTWERHGRENGVDQVAKYLAEEIRDERGEIERKAFELSKQLQPFTSAGMYGEFFNGEANISFDNDLIYLELEELKSAPELRTVVLYAVTNRIMREMYLKRDRKKICLIDEAWQLLGDDEETAKFIEEGYRRARKYNGIFAVGTQGIGDAFKNEASRAAYNNADWKFYLRQDTKNFDELVASGKVNFGPTITRQIKSLQTEGGRYSELLISSPMGDAVMRHVADPFSLAMASTNARDYTRLEQLQNEGKSTIQAIEIMLHEKGHHI